MKENTLSTIAIIMSICVIIVSIYALYTSINAINELHKYVEEPVETTCPAEVTEPVETTCPTEPTEITEPVIDIWWTDEELDMLAAVVYYEAGSEDCTDRHQQLVAQVVLNRINDKRYPDTMRGVVTQNGQYSTYKLVLKNMGTSKIPQRCYDNALVALNGDVECPENVIYQANFKQGKGVYEKLKTSYSTSYFCYG